MRTASVKSRPRAVHLQLLFKTSAFIQSGLGKRESGRQETVQPARKAEPTAFASLFDGLVVRRPNSLESSPLATEGKFRAWSRCTGRLVRGLIHGDDEAKRALPWSSFRRASGCRHCSRRVLIGSASAPPWQPGQGPFRGLRQSER